GCSRLSESCEAGAAVFPIDAGDLVGRNAIFRPVAPREGDERRKRATEGCRRQPPDMPDEREAEEGREEGAYEPGRAIARQLDVRISRLILEHVLSERALL